MVCPGSYRNVEIPVPWGIIAGNNDFTSIISEFIKINYLLFNITLTLCSVHCTVKCFDTTISRARICKRLKSPGIDTVSL